MINGILVLFVFGFAGGIMSLLLSALGIWKKWPILLVLAGLWAVPATLYISGAFGLPIYLIALLQFGAIYALKKDNPRLAWLLLIPLAIATAFMFPDPADLARFFGWTK